MPTSQSTQKEWCNSTGQYSRSSVSVVRLGRLRRAAYLACSWIEVQGSKAATERAGVAEASADGVGAVHTWRTSLSDAAHSVNSTRLVLLANRQRGYYCRLQHMPGLAARHSCCELLMHNSDNTSYCTTQHSSTIAAGVSE